ncbi:MAG: signal recognition particle receptor subunit alpha, partial [Muribaculaceae bacterium]|nr:signal recognition particle receptor subunit alpha [Muribaculaceae bacterium]
MGFFKKLFSKEKKEKLDTGLQKTKEGVWSKITRAVAGKSKVDDDVIDNLEEAFITSDVGVDTTLKIIDRIQARVARDKYVGSEELNNLLCEEITDLLARPEEDENLEDFEIKKGGDPYVIMVVGVNGVGKTTTIGKLAAQYK